METEAAFAAYVPAVLIPIILLSFVWLPWNLWRALGALLVLGFLALITIARIQLGNSFSIEPQARRLVTSGIYSRIRHPIYIFSSMIVLGFSFYFMTPWFAATLILIVPIQIIRAHYEEKILIQTFGEAYLAYRKSTWF